MVNWEPRLQMKFNYEIAQEYLQTFQYMDVEKAIYGYVYFHNLGLL